MAKGRRRNARKEKGPPTAPQKEMKRANNGLEAAAEGTSLQQETAKPGKKHKKALEEPTKADVALKGLGRSAGPQGRLHSSAARLSHEEQGREAALGNNGNLARRAS